jgi:WD40 repeat protein
VVVLGRDVALHFFQLGADGALTADGDAAIPPNSSMAEITPMVVNPARTMVAAGFNNGAVRLWRLDTKALVWDNRDHGGTVGGLTFSPDGGTLATGSQDGTALFYDVSGYTVTPSKNHLQGWDNGTVRWLAYSNDGRYIAVAGYWYTEVWDAATHARLKEFTRAQETGGSVVWVGNDTELLATGKGQFARVWDARPNGHLRRVQAHGGGAWCVALSPNGDLLASAGNSGDVKLWKWPSMEPAFELPPHHGRARALAFSHDGKTLASASADGVMKLWDMESRHCRLTVDDVRREYYSVAFSPDDTQVVTTTRDDAVRVYDLESGNLTTTLHGSPGGGFVSATYTADGTRMAASHGHVISVWDAPMGGAAVEMVTPDSSGWTLHWLEKLGVLADGTWDGSIVLFQVPDPKPIRTLTGHTQIVLSLCNGPKLSDGSRALVSSSMDGNIKLWNPATGTCLLTLNSETGAVSQIIAMPDGRTLISAHEDGTLGVWDLGYYEPHIRSAAGFH